MTNELPVALGTVVALGFLYPIAARLAGEMVQEPRKRLRKKAWELLEDTNLPGISRIYVKMAIKDSVSPWTFLPIILLFPIFLVIAVRERGREHVLPAYRRKEVEQIANDSIVSAFAANPFLAAVFLVVCCLSAPLLILVMPNSRERIESQGWRAPAEICIEEKISRRVLRQTRTMPC